MASIVAERETAPWYKRLFLPAYRVGDAARYTGSHPQTVTAWHHRRNPVLPGREPKRPLSYLELVEVAFVSYFRRTGVSLQRIRRDREYVAEIFTTDYPFAEYKLKTEGHHILMDCFKIDAATKFDGLIVTDAAGRLAWTDLMGDRFAEFDYELDLAITWYPSGRDSLVKIDPRIAFGAPIAEGIPTLAIKGRWAAGESFEEIQEDFNVSDQAVKDALHFERVEIGSNGNER